MTTDAIAALRAAGRTRLRIGTRGSDLALWQARHIAARLGELGLECELVVLKTRGDAIDDVPLSTVEGKAFFTAEIERALLAGEVDLAVHSFKDMALESVEGLRIAAVPARGPQGERLLIEPRAHDPGAPFLPLRRGARVGTSAPRRAEQVRTLRPDLAVVDLRGNVPTRVKRLREGRYDAIVLAVAGLERLALDLGGLVAIDLPMESMVPAPAQGALAVQVRADDGDLADVCARLDDAETARAVAAERTAFEQAGGGCSLPLGAAIYRVAGAERSRPTTPSAQRWGTHGAGAGDTESGETWRAALFLAAGYPADAPHARWAIAGAASPEAAARAALQQVASGAPTGVGPLAPLRVALTGSGTEGSELAVRLAALGARVVGETVLEFEPTGRGADLERALAALAPGDVLAVTSRRAALEMRGAHIAAGVTVAAVGESTARALAEIGLAPQIVGAGGGRELAERLALAPGRRVVLPCAESTLGELERDLIARGADLVRIPLYRTRAAASVELDPTVDARIYTSPSAVAAAEAWERAHARRTTIRFALGRATATALARAGLDAVEPAADLTLGDAVVAEIARSLQPTLVPR
jgi:hydroxymethylbilane synthase